MRATKLLTIIAIIVGFNFTCFAQNDVKFTEEMWTLPTYKVEPAEKAPMFYTGGSFQGARRVVYPYALNDVISNQKVEKDWKF